jgi:hypothetical protein
MGKAKNQHQLNLKIGDSVTVKPGTKDPDTGGDLSGWRGCIIEFGEDEGRTTVCIEWDSATLKSMPRSAVEHCERAKLDWRSMYLYATEVEPAVARDTERDVEEAVAEMETHSSWLHLDEEGRRIQQVLDGIDPHDEMGLLDAWEEHLREKLRFPFEAEVTEWQERGPLRPGDRLKVKGISGVDDLYGIIVEVRRGRERFDFPLCDLEVTDKKSANYQPVKDYAVWFANR